MSAVSESRAPDDILIDLFIVIADLTGFDIYADCLHSLSTATHRTRWQSQDCKGVLKTIALIQINPVRVSLI
jgi:hypothetical protein